MIVTTLRRSAFLLPLSLVIGTACDSQEALTSSAELASTRAHSVEQMRRHHSKAAAGHVGSLHVSPFPGYEFDFAFADITTSPWTTERNCKWQQMGRGCRLLTCDTAIESPKLDAGTINMTGTESTVDLTADAAGNYMGSLLETPLWNEAGDPVKISYSGLRHPVALTLAGPPRALALTELPSTIDRGEPLSMTWPSVAQHGALVRMFLYSYENMPFPDGSSLSKVAIECVAPLHAGELRVPARVLGRLPAGMYGSQTEVSVEDQDRNGVRLFLSTILLSNEHTLD